MGNVRVIGLAALLCLAAACVGVAMAGEDPRETPPQRQDERRRHDDDAARVGIGIGLRLLNKAANGKPAQAADDPPPSLYGSEAPPDIYGHDAELKRGCRVQRARLGYNGATDAAPETPNQPLTMPTDYTAPAPGAAGSTTTGPSQGPIPGSNPAQAFAGNAFEYHSDVSTYVNPVTHQADTRDPCTSEQFARYFSVTIDRTTNRINGFDAKSTGLPSPKDQRWPVDLRAPMAGAGGLGRSLFDGGAAAGIRTARDRNGAPFRYYQGTPSTIHWVDTPGLVVNVPAPNPAAPETRVLVIVAVIKSVTYDGGHGRDKAHPSGWSCLSGHSVAMDLATGAPLAPAATRALFTATTAKRGAGKIEREATAALNAPAAQGGHQGLSNPEFRDLGCHRFGPPPA